MSTPISTSTDKGSGTATSSNGLALKLLGAWTFVGVPLAYGIIQTVKRAAALFTG